MSLREELARQLMWAVTAATNADDWWNEQNNPWATHYLRLADECIRQMEWARRGDPNAKQQAFAPLGTVRDPNIGLGFTPLEWVSLSLAPKDWKP